METIENKLISTNLMILLMIWLGYFITLIETIPTSQSTLTLKSTKLSTNNNDNYDLPSFASIYELNDGEIVTKFRWKNFLAIETRFNDIDLIQITKDNKQIIQFWLTNNELIDCEYTNDSKTIKKFQYEFLKINPNMFKDSKNYNKLLESPNVQNTTQEQLLPENLKKLTKFQNYEQQCLQLHQKIQKHFESSSSNSKKKKRRRPRSKRDLLVFPGTNWCGKGSNGKEFEDLGDYSFADRCCRDHDRCKYSIGPFESQYHLFNYRFHYVSHCSCDERFRSCLKVANSGAANLVGKIYFNVVKTKCFMFQMDDMCIERTWWGNCIQTKRRKRAVFRDPLAY